MTLQHKTSICTWKFIGLDYQFLQCKVVMHSKLERMNMKTYIYILLNAAAAKWLETYGKFCILRHGLKSKLMTFFDTIVIH